MAHECPDCGMTCYCGSDIDDCLNNFEEDVMRCTHYKECQNESEEDDGVEMFTDDEYNKLVSLMAGVRGKNDKT